MPIFSYEIFFNINSDHKLFHLSKEWYDVGAAEARRYIKCG